MTNRIGRFTIEKEIGQGAFGRVYRALDPNFGRLVAIKVLVSEGDQDLLERFRAEAGTTAALSHKNIVTVYGFEVENGVPFLQMELLQGKTLREIIDQASVSGILEKVEIMYQVAEGLNYAHGKGVIHCDMKPGNIMVQPSGEVKIMDFGIARVANQDGTWRSRKEEFAGTIPYMAPEQFRDEQTTKLADIFSFGVIFYELLSGVQPFAAKDPRTVMYRITTLSPAPLLEQLPTLPEALDALVQRMMHKEQELRLPDMQEMLLDAQPILQELRKERAAQMAVDIEPLLSASDLAGAQRLVKRILELDPTHVAARRAWREIQLKVQDQALRDRTDSLAKDGRRHLSERRFAAAISCFETALNLDNRREDIQVLRDEARRIQDNVRSAGRLVAEARWELTQGQAQKALENLRQAVELDPEGREAGPLLVEVRERIRLAHNTQILGRVNELTAKELFEEALAALEELDGEMPEASGITKQIEIARREALERARAAALAAGLARVRDLCGLLQLVDAEAEAQKVCASFPGNSEAEECLAEVRERLASQRRREAIAAIHKSAAELLEAKRYDEACTLLREGMQHFRDDEPMRLLLEQAENLEVFRQRSVALSTAINEIRLKRDHDDLAGAFEAIRQALATFGEEPTLAELRVALEDEQQRREVAAALALLVGSASQLVTTGEPQRAVKLLQEKQSIFGKELGWQRALEEAEESSRIREQQLLKRQEGAIAAAEAAGQLQEALKLTEKALLDSPNHDPFQVAVKRIRSRLIEADRQRRLGSHLQRIDEAITQQAWDAAFSYQRVAQAEFPQEAAIASRADAVAAGRHHARLLRAQLQIRSALHQRSWELSLERLLTATDMFPDEPSLALLWEECEKRLLADSDGLEQVIGILEAFQSRGLSDPHVARILDESRDGWARRQAELAHDFLERASQQEENGNVLNALAVVEAALKKHSDNSELLSKASELRHRILDEERSELLQRHVAAIESSIGLQDWLSAHARLAEAQVAFPDAPVLGGLSDSINRTRRKADLEEFERTASESLSLGDLKSFAVKLVAARESFANETAWKKLWGELERGLASSEQRIQNLPWLHEVARQFPGESGIKRLEASAAKALRVRQDLLHRARKHIDTLEQGGNLEEALSEARAAVKQFPEDHEFPSTVRRLEQLINERETESLRSEYVAMIGAATEEGAWESATDHLAAAIRDFPADKLWDEIAAAIRNRRREAERRDVENTFREAFQRHDFIAAAQILAEDRKEGASEPGWLNLVSALESEIPVGSGRQEILASLADLAERLPDFGELRSLLDRASETDAAKRQAARQEAEDRIGAAEIEANIDQALAEAHRALAVFPDDPEFRVVVERLQARKFAEAHSRAIETRCEEIEGCILAERWTEAEQKLSDASLEFPDADDFAEFAGRIEVHRLAEELAALERDVLAALGQNRLDHAEQFLSAARTKHFQKAIWQRLRKELERHQSYNAGLQQAERAFQDREYARAKSILKWLLATPPDSRASELMKSVERAAPKKTRGTR